MPQTVTITKELFTFDELSDVAKERARSWYRESRYEDTSEFDFTIEDFVTIAEIIGITFSTHEVKLMSGKSRTEPNIYWSLSYSQGDGACFEGTYEHNDDSCAKIREHCNDDELLRVTDELNRIQSGRVLLGQPMLDATIKKTDHHYCHENTVTIDVDDVQDDWEVEGQGPSESFEEARAQIAELLKDLMRWLHKALRDEDEYRNSDEAVDESIEANEYTFDEEGNRDD